MRITRESTYHALQRVAPGVALFLFLCGIYLLTTSGHTYSSDEETMLAAGESLVNHGWFNIPRSELFLMNRARGVDGLSYSRYGPGMSLALVPFIWLGQALGQAAPAYTPLMVRFSALALPALVTAGTAWLLYAWVRLVGYTHRVALVVGLLFGLTSIAWPYSRTLFAEPLATFFLVVCAYGLCRTTRGWWALAGAAAGAALATKFQTGLALPLIAGYGLLQIVQRPNQRLVAGWPAAVAGRLLYGLLGLALPLGLLLLHNWRLFGGPLLTGYGSIAAGTQLLSGDWRAGLYGLTISTGKGLLLFAPTVLLGLLGLACDLRRQWRESLLAFGLLVLHLAYYSQLEYWHGDGSWGPRYLVFVTPFLYLPVAGLLASLSGMRETRDQTPADTRHEIGRQETGDRRQETGDRRQGGTRPGNPIPNLQPPIPGIQSSLVVKPALSLPKGRWSLVIGRWSLIALAVAGLLVQVLPLLVNFNVYLQVSRPGARYFVATASPMLAQVRIWRERATEWWWRLVAAPPGSVLLRNDFSYSEGDRTRGELLPRWTYANAEMRLFPAEAGALRGRLVVGDHRPWPLPRANFGLLLDGQPIEPLQRVDLDGNQIRWALDFDLTAAQNRSGATLLLKSDTWNPNRDTSDNPRNEDLGLLLEGVELRQGTQLLTLREALPIPAPQLTRRGLWLWTQDAPNHHLFDTWLWYLAVARIPPAAALTVLLVLGLPGLLALLVGGWGVAKQYRR